MSCHYSLRELKRIWLIYGELLGILLWCVIGVVCLYFFNQLILSKFFE